MTFKQLQDDTLERTTFDASKASSSARTRIKRFLNEIYGRVLRETGMSRFTTGTATITTVQGQAEYVINGAAQIRKVYIPVSGWVLTETSLSDLRDLDPENSAVSSNPEYYAVTKVGASTLVVRLYPTPSNDTTQIALDISAATAPLEQDADVPVLPEDFHYLLGTGARMLEFERMEKFDNYEVCRREFEKGLRSLRYFLAKSRRKPPRFNRKGTFAAQSGGNWIEWGVA